MANKSRMERYRVEITELVKKGVSTRSAWKIINYNLPDEAKISYNAFNYFVNTHIKSEKDL